MRGPNARRAITVLLSDSERAEINQALADENREAIERGCLRTGLGSKMRELALRWARRKSGGRRDR